jgi:ATP-dependent Clp protease ATP-binding subunit ClpC
VFESFTERARQVVVHAHDEARTLGHNYIGTEHLLIGVLREPESAACRILEARGIELDAVLAWVAREVGRGKWRATGDLAFTARAKQALELSVRESEALGAAYVDAEHVLLGLTRVGGGIAARIMDELGAEPRVVADEVLQMIGPATG